MMALGNYLVMVQTAIYDPEDRAVTFFFYCGLQVAVPTPPGCSKASWSLYPASVNGHSSSHFPSLPLSPPQTFSTAAFLVLVKTVFQPWPELPGDTVDQ